MTRTQAKTRLGAATMSNTQDPIEQALNILDYWQPSSTARRAAIRAAAWQHWAKAKAELKAAKTTLDQISRYAHAATVDGMTVDDMRQFLHTISKGAAKAAQD